MEHVVILMQENRAFDHYFGAMNGVRGFGDRFPIPVPDSPGLRHKTVWTQVNDTGKGGPPLVSPFPLDTIATFAHMRVESTPHSWSNAQEAWDEGRMNRWPAAKTERAMGYYRREDIPFQYAMANAFTLCDAYHCSTQTGTNTNRLFLWTATNDASGRLGGPRSPTATTASVADGGAADPYRWTTYAERLLAAGVTWRIYQDMADNFTDNPTAGFKTYRDSHAGLPGSDPRLAAPGPVHPQAGRPARGRAGRSPAAGVVHRRPGRRSRAPRPSSPAQGADYTARVIDALTADPRGLGANRAAGHVRRERRLLRPRPAARPRPRRPPTERSWAPRRSTTAGEYHLVRNPTEAEAERDELMGRPYGLGRRVPLYVLSPWSRGGWVNSQVFDHTSVIRFLEARFGVAEPNISPWRRAVCGDLTTAFDFNTPNDTPFPKALPATRGPGRSRRGAEGHRHTADAGRAGGPGPGDGSPPLARPALRPARGRGRAGRPSDADVPPMTARRRRSSTSYDAPAPRPAAAPTTPSSRPSRPATPGPPALYDLWVLGPNGFHRHF